MIEIRFDLNKEDEAAKVKRAIDAIYGVEIFPDNDLPDTTTTTTTTTTKTQPEPEPDVVEAEQTQTEPDAVEAEVAEVTAEMLVAIKKVAADKIKEKGESIKPALQQVILTDFGLSKLSDVQPENYKALFEALQGV